jgi:hypothetical protein
MSYVYVHTNTVFISSWRAGPHSEHLRLLNTPVHIQQASMYEQNEIARPH